MRFWETSGKSPSDASMTDGTNYLTALAGSFRQAYSMAERAAQSAAYLISIQAND